MYLLWFSLYRAVCTAHVLLYNFFEHYVIRNIEHRDDIKFYVSSLTQHSPHPFHFLLMIIVLTKYSHLGQVVHISVGVLLLARRNCSNNPLWAILRLENLLSVPFNSDDSHIAKIVLKIFSTIFVKRGTPSEQMTHSRTGTVHYPQNKVKHTFTHFQNQFVRTKEAIEKVS